MHFYRYRFGSLLSIKEMMYNEIYFGSQKECNDPFDSKAFYQFPDDPIRWKRLLDQALQVEDTEFKKFLLEDLTSHLCSLSPVSLEDLVEQPFLDLPELRERFQQQTLQNMEAAIRRFISTYIPPTRYFACFSTVNAETLMWAHYANNHKGFCLIFKSIENKIKQDPNHKKRQIRRKTLKGIAPDMTYQMPADFEFQPIDYKANVEPLNAFQSLSSFVYGKELTEEEANTLRTNQQSHFRQKHHAWHYEKEYRTVLSPPPSWLFGGQQEYTPHERLFRYDPNQLVGIIFGARMPETEKIGIIEIINDMLDRRYDNAVYPFIRFDFITFNAKLSTNQRSIEIHPREILGVSSLKFGEKDFDRRYQEWKDGWGFERKSERESGRVHVPK